MFYYFWIECGLKYSTPNVKIVGGTEAVQNSWPSIALIRTCNGTSCYLCGGSLIDRSTVLTAAHCIKSAGFTYTVYLGLY
jgi:secreted trypsin-like serine protease